MTHLIIWVWTTTPYASNGHATRVRLNCVVVAGGFSYLFHYTFVACAPGFSWECPPHFVPALCSPHYVPHAVTAWLWLRHAVVPLGEDGATKVAVHWEFASCVAMRGYFWRNIETCALKMFECERLFVNSTALNLSHVAILMMMISFLKCAFFRTLNFLMYIACSLNSILNAKMHGPCREHNLQRNFTGLVTAPTNMSPQPQFGRSV